MPTVTIKYNTPEELEKIQAFIKEHNLKIVHLDETSNYEYINGAPFRRGNPEADIDELR